MNEKEEEKNIVDAGQDAEFIRKFKQTNNETLKYIYFIKIQDDNNKMMLLDGMPEKERCEYIIYLKLPHNIVQELDHLTNEQYKSRAVYKILTCAPIIRERGNSDIEFLKILAQLNNPVTLKRGLRDLLFFVENLEGINMDLLLNIQKKVTNYKDMKFILTIPKNYRKNKGECDCNEYSFEEFSAIIARLEELKSDISDDMDEADKFYTIYSRLTKNIQYDYNCVRKSDEIFSEYKNNQLVAYIFGDKENLKEVNDEYQKKIIELRKYPRSVYGALVNGKAICKGIATAVHTALQYIGMESKVVEGDSTEEKKDCFDMRSVGHVWLQVKIGRYWYNVDPTWDSGEMQTKGKYKYMLLDDETFYKSHDEYRVTTKGVKKCTHKFNYSKIKNLDANQIDTGEEDEHKYE